MSNDSLPDPVLITRQKALQRLADSLHDEPVLAVDTESNSLYAYREQVCLVQFSTPQTDYLVDPLALKDLSPLAPIFNNPQIEKIFHAAEYDLICLQRDFGFEFHNLFDTMVAARILGWQSVGLGSVLQNVFGVHLDKRGQRANWGERPIPVHLLKYARLDTHYLIPLREHLANALHKQDLWTLAQEDFDRLSSLKSIESNGRLPPEKNDFGWWRVRGASDLTPQQAAVLFELCRYRDQAARSLNRPLFKVINDHTLLAIAEQQPQNNEQLSRLPGMTPGQVRRHGQSLLQAVTRGLQANPLYPPRQPRPDERFSERLDMLRNWRKNTARDLGMHSDVVLPRDLLYVLAEQNPTQFQSLEDLLMDVPWRLDRFGDQILQLLSRRRKR